MGPTSHATEGDVVAAIVEAGKAIYLAEESTAKSIASGSKQQVNISEHFLNVAEQDVKDAINSFNSYEQQVRASEHTSFWGSLFSWVLVVVSAIASAFAGPEILAITLVMVVASKTGLTNKIETALGNAIGSKLLASVILTAAVMAVGAGAGAGAGMLTEDAGSVVAEEAGTVVADDAGNVAAKEGESIGSKIRSAGKAVTKRIGSLSRRTAGALNGLGQGLQNFNVGAEVMKKMAALNAKWATDLGITLDVLISLVAVVSQGAGTGNGMMRAAAAGKGLCGSSILINNVGLFKGVGTMGMASGAGEGSCGIATGALDEKQASALSAYIEAQGQSSLFDAMKDLSHQGFNAWVDGYKSLEKSLAQQADAVGESISAVNTQLAIAMSGRG